MAADAVIRSSLRPVLETALDAVVVMGSDGSVRDWNRQAETLFGWSREEALGRSMAELVIPPEHRAAHTEGLRRYLELGDGPILGRCIEVTAIDRSGRVFPVELSVSAGEEACEIVFIGFVRDISERRRAEAARLHQESQFRLMVDALPLFVAVVGLDWRYQLVNRTYETWFGMRREEIIGKTVREVLGEEGYQARRPHLAAAMAGESVRFETFTSRLGQEDRLTELIYQPRLDPQGNVEAVSVVGIDIGERWEAQRALRVEQDRSRNVLEHMGDGFALLDHDFRVLQINSAGLRLEQRPAEMIVGKTHWEAWPGTEHSELGAVYKRAMAERIPLLHEHRFRWPYRKDWSWLEVRAQPSPEGLALFYRDITDRKLADEVLQSSESRFRTLADVLPALVWMSSAEGKVLYLNERWYEYTGASSGAEVGIDPGDYMHPGDQAMVAGLWVQALGRGVGFESELHFGRDGTYRWFLSRAEPIKTAGAVTGWIGASTDIQDRRQGEERLKLMVDELNHRVKNNLAMVQALAAQTFRGTESVPQARDAFMIRLVALAKAHDILTRQHWDGIHLADIAHEALAPIVAAGERVTAQGPSVSLNANTALALSMALHELLTNAVKYGALSSPAGKVALTWSLEPLAAGARLGLVWTETGGPAVTRPTTTGFGTRLLERSLAGELNGEVALDYRPEGLVCTISADLT